MTLAKARKVHEQAGGKFFTKSSMEYWGSKIESELFDNNCFITSEYDYTGEYKFYNVRQFSPDFKKIRTVSEFNKLTTKGAAVNLIRDPNRWVNSSF